MDNQLDPSVVNLAKAIRQTESGGDYTIVGDKKASHRSYGAYQFGEDTWNNTASKYGIDVPIQKASPEQQNAVAYNQIKEWKDAGYDVTQIASMWNAGKGEPNAYTGKFSNGQPSVKKGKFDVPAYTKSVATAYQTLKQGGQVGPDPNNPSSINSPYQQQDQSPSLGGFVGNVVSSGANFLGGIGSAIRHPISTAENLGKVAVGGVEKLIPGQQGQEQNFDQLLNFYKERYGGASNIAHTLYTDPVGAAADASMLLGGAGAITSKLGLASELSDAARMASTGATLSDVSAIQGTSAASKLGNIVSKASEIANPLNLAGKAIGLGSKMAEGAGVRGMATLTGKEPETLRSVINNPSEFSGQNLGNLTRASLGEEIASELKNRSSAISETGAGYGGVRALKIPVQVDKGFLDNLIKETAGVEIKNGKIIGSAGADIRDASDIRALQQLYDTYKPVFQKGKIDANQFLNLRHDLGEMAKYNREFTASKPLEGISSVMRNKLNTAYREKVPGLKSLDEKMAPQLTEFENLKKGILDKNGELNDAAINRIANATGKGKDLLLKRLEEIKPGITQKVKIVKAMEDLQNFTKVGTYTRSAIEGGGLVGGIATGNPALIASSLVTMFLSNPNVAIKILRGYGASKAVIAKLMLDKLNNLQPAIQGATAVQRLNQGIR